MPEPPTKPNRRRAWPFAVVALALLSCQLAGKIGQTTAEPTASPTPGREATPPPARPTPGREATPPPARPTPEQPGLPLPTAAPGTVAPAPALASPTPAPGAWAKPPQSTAAELRPTEMRPAITRLSNLIGFRVLDVSGGELGQAGDYIVNTCETYLLYILMTPATGSANGGGRVVIPYEAVTVNSGLLDAQARAIQLRLAPEQLAGAPVLPDGLPLTPTDWETAVREFWSKAVRIGSLKTSCNVPGGPVYKVAYASELLKAPLYDGRGELLGVVQEAILAPESGKLAFYVVRPTTGPGLVMVRLAVTNLPKEALAPGGVLSLELLTEPQKFWDAPRIAALYEAESFAQQGKMLQYWGR